MRLMTLILGGTAAVALAFGAAPSIAQQQAQATQDQTAPAASSSDQATPSASSDEASSSTKTMTSTKKVRHHRTGRGGRSTPQERAETRRLNQEQLARAQGAGDQGRYGTMEQQAPANNSPTPGQVLNPMNHIPDAVKPAVPDVPQVNPPSTPDQPH